jgi:hypothetical protein
LLYTGSEQNAAARPAYAIVPQLYYERVNVKEKKKSYANDPTWIFVQLSVLVAHHKLEKNYNNIGDSRDIIVIKIILL